jgi:hypothetical protein
MVVKKVHERSPLRVFERSIHGGLGAGNLGVILCAPAWAETAFMVGIALDSLMRGSKVFRRPRAVRRSRARRRDLHGPRAHDPLDDAASVRSPSSAGACPRISAASR